MMYRSSGHRFTDIVYTHFFTLSRKNNAKIHAKVYKFSKLFQHFSSIISLKRLDEASKSKYTE